MSPRLKVVGLTISLVLLTITSGFSLFSKEDLKQNGNILRSPIALSEHELLFQEGQRLYYSFELATLLGSDLSPSGEEHNIKTKLFTKIIQKDHESVWLGMQFYGVQYRVGNRHAQKEETALSTPFLLRLSLNGEIEEVIYSAALNSKLQDKLYGLISQLNISTDKQKQLKWQAFEKDTTGTYLASYKYSGAGEILKRKLDYVSYNSAEGVLNHVEIDPSKITIKFSNKHSWLESLEGEEVLRIYAAADLKITAKLKTALRSIDNENFRPDWEDQSLGEIIQSLNSAKVPDEEMLVTASNNFIHMDSVLTQKKFEQALEKINSKIKPQEILEATTLLADIMRSSPEMINKIVGLLNSGELSDEVCGHLIYALQKCATIEAQVALLSVAKREGGSEVELNNQKRAIIALGFMPLSKSAEDSLWEIYSNQKDPNSTTKSEMALLSLGTLSDSLDEIEPTRSLELVHKLESIIENNSNSNSYENISSALLALGNTARHEAVPYLQKFSQHESDTVRLSAAKAMLSYNTDTILETAREQLLEEDSPQVRSALVGVVQSNKSDSQTYQAMQQLFIEEEDKAVRLKMAKYLVEQIDSFPENRSNIKKIIELETEPEIYKILVEALAE